jgi:transcriptional regulator with XRE-family HTH domain
LQFNLYLKTCRESSRLTQKQLVQQLYAHDIQTFKSLDTSILSKWERGAIQPQISKQVSIIKYFQQHTGKSLPCFENYTESDIVKLIDEGDMLNLLGKSKKLVLDFPSGSIRDDELVVYQLKYSDEIDKYISINVDLDRDFNHNLTGLYSKQFKEWALNPVNSFYVCEYREQFFGLLFALRVKREIFEKLMKHQIDETALEKSDCATENEKGSSYIISFFAMNDKAATKLFTRYYAHLIAHQKSIIEIGASTMMEDAKKLIANIHLEFSGSKIVAPEHTLHSYRAALADFLAHEKVLRALFS